MGFLNNLGGGRLIIGAETAGLRRVFRSAVTDMKVAVNEMAADAKIGTGRVSASYDRMAASTRAASAETVAANNRAGASMERNAAISRESSAANVASHQKMGAAATNAATQGEKAAGRWAKAWGLMASVAKLGIVGIAGAVFVGVKEAADFEKQWAAVNKTVGDTPEKMLKLRGEIRAMAREMPVAVGDLAKVAETAGALGVPTANIKEFVKIAAMIGSTTNVSVDQAATSLGVLGNIVNLRSSDYKKFASALVDLGNKGASTEKQILDITTRSAAAGKLLGLSTQSILAIASTAASMGVNPEAGGTALATIFSQLVKVTGQEGKAAKGGKDLTKVRADLAIAEQRLAEQRANATTKLSTLMASEARVKSLQATLASGGGGKGGTLAGADSFAKVAGITTKAWKDLIATKPEDAFQKLVVGLGKLTAPEQLAKLKEWGMSGLRVRNVMLLLAKNPAELARQMGISVAAWEKGTAAQEAYAKKTANLIDRLKILWNVIKDQLISLGEVAIPILTKMVDWLAKNIPGAVRTLGKIWDGFWSTAGKPIGEAIDSLGKFFGALTGGGKGDVGKTMADIFTSLGNAVGFAAKMLKILLDAGSEFVRSPIGQFAINMLGPVLALGAAISGVSLLARKLTGISGGVARFLFGGLPGLGSKGPAMTPEAQSLNNAGTRLTGSAAAHEAAAAKLTLAAASIERAVVSEYLDPVTGLGLRNSMRMAGDNPGAYGRGANGMLTSVPLSMKDDYLKNQLRMDAAGKGIVAETQAALATGVGRAARVGRGLVGGAKSLLSGAAKLFWPLMLADMATEFLKAPIGNWVSQNTGFKNLGKRISEDFWGGLVDAVRVVATGTDAWVGKAAITTIGKAKISTIEIAKLGFTSAEIDAIQTPTLSNAGYQLGIRAAQAKANAITAPTNATSAIGLFDLANSLGVDTSGVGNVSTSNRELVGKGIAAINGDLANTFDSIFGGAIGLLGGTSLTPDPATLAPLTDEIRKKLVEGAKEALRAAVQQALTGLGIRADAWALPEAVMGRIAKIIGADKAGQFPQLTAYLSQRQVTAYNADAPLVTAAELRRRRGLKGPVPIAGIGLGAEQTLQIPDETALAFAQNMQRVTRAKGKYADWQKGVNSDTSGMSQYLVSQAQGVVDKIGPQIESAGGNQKSRLRLFHMLFPKIDLGGAKKLTQDQWQQVLTLYEQAGKASGADQRKHIADLTGQAWMQAAAEGSKKWTPKAVQLWFTQHKAAVQAALSGNKGNWANTQFTAALGSKDPKAGAASLFTSLGLTFDPKTFDPSKFKSFGAALAGLFAVQLPAGKVKDVGDLATAFGKWKEGGTPDPTKVKKTSDSVVTAAAGLAKTASPIETIASNAPTAATGLAAMAEPIRGIMNDGPMAGNALSVIWGLVKDILGTPTPVADSNNGRGAGGAGSLPGVTPATSGGANPPTGVPTGKSPTPGWPLSGGGITTTLPDTHISTQSMIRMPDGSTGTPTRTQHIYADKIQVLGPADQESLLHRLAFLSNN